MQRILRGETGRQPGGHYRVASLFGFLLAFALVSRAWAQLAPAGEHYAGQPSDTGFGGTAVDATGNFPIAVPLKLPPARGGMRVPVQIRYSAGGVGAAGLGWDLPLSYIEVNGTLAHRRPLFQPGTLPGRRNRATLSLFGQTVDLIHEGDAWIARFGTLELAVRETSGGWLAYDGQGRTYGFESPPGLANTGLSLLKSISAAGGLNVELDYQLTTWPLDGGIGTAVDLVRVAYNHDPNAGPPPSSCAKNEIALSYLHGSITPIAMSLLEEQVLVRKNTLTQIDVRSRANCASPLQSFAATHLTIFPTPTPACRGSTRCRCTGKKARRKATRPFP